MTKRLSILAFVLLCAAAVSAQHKKRVLVEEFTNASCPPCASQNPGFHSVLTPQAGITTVIKYQVDFPGFDPMNKQNPSDVETRRGYYGITGVPHGLVNGVSIANDCNAYLGAPACLSTGDITTANNVQTPVTISLNTAMTADYDSVLIYVSVTSDAALTGALRLRVLVLEEEIDFETSAGSNGETEFYQVMRKMLPNPAGTATGNFTAGETKTYSFAWPVAYFYNLNQFSAAAFLQNDDTKVVLQSERSLPLGLDIVDDGVEIKSEKVFACAAGYSPSFTLTNTGSGTLTSAGIRYRLGNAAWSDLIWTGSLAPGESDDIQLTSIVINTSGTSNVEVVVTGSNLGIQTNLAAVSTIKVIASMAAAQPLPFSNVFQSAAFPPAGWVNDANDAAYNWKLATNAGAGSSRSARCSLAITPQGQQSRLITPKIDLSTATGATSLKFDHAYTYYDVSFFDSLRIEISSDCGENWETIFHDGKIGLATAPPYPQLAGWIPDTSQWRGNQIDISAFNGNPEVLIRFVAESGFGQNMYIDNVNVSTTVGTKELTLTSFELVPNPSRDYAEVRFGLETAQNISLRVYNAEGALVQSQLLGDLSSGDHRVVLNSTALPSGSYHVILQGSEGLAQSQWVVIK